MSHGPIDAFLAELGRLLRRDEERRGRVVTEVGDHLRDLAAEARARGLGEQEAELDAIDRFGSPRDLARGLRTRRARRTVRVAGGVAVAGCCAVLALVFAERHPSAPRVAGSPAVHAMPAPRALSGWCADAIQAAINSHSSGQIMIQIDPRTGRVVSWRQGHGYAVSPVCHLTPIDGRSGGVWIAGDPAAPFG